MTDPTFTRDVALLAALIYAMFVYRRAWLRVRRYELSERPDDARGLMSSLAVFALFGLVLLPLVCGVSAWVIWGMWQ